MDLFKDFNLKNLSPVSYICGDDIWMKQECLNEILKHIDNQNKKVEYYKFDGKDINVSDLIDLCESVPLGCDLKCIVIKDWELDKLEKKAMAILCEIFSDLAEFCVVVIANVNISVSKAKIKKFVEIIKQNGKLIELTSKNKIDVLTFISEGVKAEGSNISAQNAKLLADYCGNEMGKISEEIKKLTAFCKGLEINADDIKKLVVPNFEIRVFDLVKFINIRDKKRATQMLINLINNKEDLIMILSIISMNFIDIYRAKIAKKNNKTVDDVLNLFDYKGKEFRVTKAFMEASKYNINQIKDILSFILEADYKIKSSSVADAVILETLICKIFWRLEKP